MQRVVREKVNGARRAGGRRHKVTSFVSREETDLEKVIQGPNK